MGRSRSAEQLVVLEEPDGGQALQGEVDRAAVGARGARVPRIHADRSDAAGSGPRLSQDRVWTAARYLLSRRAHLSRAERRKPPKRNEPGGGFRGSRAGGWAQAGGGGPGGALEGDGGRHAALAGGL